MKLSKAEKETIILFNEEDKTATVHTYNIQLMNTLRRIRSTCADCVCEVENEQFVEYVIPKSWIKVRAPRQISEQQRQELADRARNNFKRGDGDK